MSAEKTDSYLLLGGTLVTPEGLLEKNMAVANGQITAITSDEPDGYINIDCQGCLILPGGVDPHVHFDFTYNGTTTLHNAETGGNAALLAGVTTVFDFIMDEDGKTPPDAAIKRRRRQLEGLPLNLKLHYCFQNEHEHVAEFIEALKQTEVDVIIFGFYKVWDEPALRRVVPLLKDRFFLGCHGMVNGNDVKRNTGCLSEACVCERTLLDAEEKEIFLMHQRLSAEFGIPLYMFHMANPDLLDMDVTKGSVFEVSQHHLFISIEQALAMEHGRLMLSGPWLQTKARQQQLLRKASQISCLGSDDAAFGLADKLATEQTGNMIKGIPGVSYRLPLMYTLGIKQKTLNWPLFLKLWSENAAAAFGLHQKGRLAAGMDADIVVFEPGAVLRRENPYDASLGWRPFDMETDGWARDVFIGGKHLVQNGRVVNHERKSR